MLTYLLYVLLALILALCTLVMLIKLTTKWDRSATCLVGKTTIVTGANSGIGFYTAQEFATRGAKVILACRSVARGEAARKRIVEATDNPNVHLKIVDFASLQSVRHFARDINASEGRLDILVNNAGAILDDGTTADGLNESMQVNYFGPFLLTLLLVDLLRKSQPSRIVNVSSITARYGSLDVNNLNYYSNSFISKISFSNYAKTKLCIQLFTNELARRLRGTGVTTNSLDPGSVYTEITRNFNFVLRTLYGWFNYLVKNCEEGAQTSIYLALSKDVQYITGEYFENCAINKMPSAALDATLARNLWEKTEELVQLTEEEISV